MTDRRENDKLQAAADAYARTQELKGHAANAFRKTVTSDLIFMLSAVGIGLMAPITSTGAALALMLPVVGYYAATTRDLRRHNLSIKQDFNDSAADYPREINTDLKPLHDRMKTIWEFGRRDLELIKDEMFGSPIAIGVTVMFALVLSPYVLPFLAAGAITGKDRTELLKLSHAAEMAGLNIKERYPSLRV